MMRHIAALTLLASLAPGARAAEPPAAPSLCQASCAVVRQDCRANVEPATVNDSKPVLSMNQNSNPYATATDRVSTPSGLTRPTEAQEVRARRAERLRLCDVQLRRCTVGCQDAANAKVPETITTVPKK